MTGRRQTPPAGRCTLPSTSMVFTLLLLGTLAMFPAGPALAQTAYKEIDVNNGGTIAGTVRLSGDRPQSATMEITKDRTSCGSRRPSPRLALGTNDCVMNAVVYLEGITEGKKLDRSGTFVVNQEKCQYVPHITVIPQGAQLVITNSDPILHNVHAYDDLRSRQTAFNIAQPVRGQKTAVKPAALVKCGEQLSMVCDAGHPWMSGYIFSASHPYYAVTDTNGHFELDNIPAGTYKVVMWHEGVGVTNKELDDGKVKKYTFEEPYIVAKEATVSANGKAAVDFELKLR